MRRTVWAAFVLVAAVGGGSRLAKADPPKPFVRASVSSIKAADAFLAKIGVNMQIGPTLEKQLQLEAGTLATDKPVGVVVVADKESWDAAPGGAAMVVGVLPAASGKATIEEIKAHGGNEVIGRDDFAARGGYFFKRGADHLFVGANNDHAAGIVDENIFKADYAASPAPLAAATLNFAALKAAVPDAYKQMVASGSALPGLNAEEVERISLQLTPEGNDAHVKLWWVPGRMAAPAAHPRPAFPGAGISEIHLAHGAGDTNPLMGMFFPAEGMDGPSPVGALVAKSDVASIGLGAADASGQSTMYLVCQSDHDADALAAFKSAWDAGVKKGGFKALSTYSEGGKTVTRAEVKPPASGGNPVFIDLTQDKHFFYLTLSELRTHQVPQLASAGNKGELPAGTVATGDADLGEFLKASASLAGGPPNLFALLLAQPLTGAHVKWTSQVASGYVYTDMTVPMALIKSLSAVVTPTIGGAPQPARSGGRGNAPRGGAATRRGAARGSTSP